MPDPIRHLFLPHHTAATAPLAADPAGEEEVMREALDYYAPVGFDRPAIERLNRLLDPMWASSTGMVVVQQQDLEWLLLWQDQVALARHREIPALRISDAEYDFVVGRHIRAARQARGLSHLDVAAALGAGQAWVEGIEHARPRPSVRLVRRIAAALSVPIGSLVSEWEARDDQPA
jgi:DNA-binding XRE family transcriptional regulator